MENISAVFQQLKKELERVENEASRFRAALAALGSSVSNRHRRTMSAAARKKISLVQKARWAKQNGQAAARPTRPVSAAARRKMAAAQRARWAKVKGPKKRTSPPFSSVSEFSMRISRYNSSPLLWRSAPSPVRSDARAG